jgi:inhibitor of KinA
VTAPGFRLLAAGDSALIVELEERIDPSINRRIVALGARLEASRLAGLRDIVPAYRSLTVYFDPLRTDYSSLVSQLTSALEQQIAEPEVAGRLVEIPVCYGGEHGPDLSAVAGFARVTESEVVALHTAATYQVFMLGFVPGFAYLGSVDRRIAAPRRTEPRVRVPAGSVGVAGEQTGIYPSETPGGWQLIGRTPLRPFDISREDPFLLRAGDRVRFRPIVPDQFDTWLESA